MNKERMIAFFDAVLAIIMTILVLDLDVPEPFTPAGLWQMRMSFFAYMLSFFWLGTLWIHQVQIWSQAELINNDCLWRTLSLLFFSSLVPFATSSVADNYTDTFAEIFYIVVMILVTLSNMALNQSMRNANLFNKKLVSYAYMNRRFLLISLLIQIAGLLIAFLIPSWALLSVVFAMLYIIFARQIGKKIDEVITEKEEHK